MTLLTQIRKRKIKEPAKDVVAGVIVALVSIPISMGYAQIAGLPAIYGLYGSLLPILVFGLLTTSPMFIVGVDAMPAVMVGTLLGQLGIAAETDRAMALVPVVAILVALWFLVFYFAKAGRIVKYISTPVMGGFISGVGVTIILMQIPKMCGGTPGTGELFELLIHAYDSLPQFHLLSACLGLATIAIIMICKRLVPKLPMTVLMMAVGAMLQLVFHLDEYGVKLLPQTSGGLPRFVFPDFSVLSDHTVDILVESISIAAVIMAQSLLATGKYGTKHGVAIDNNKELLAYAGMNIAGAAIGACPINGSVSRSGLADSYGAKTQIVSLTAAATMLLILLFGTPLLSLLPVPILTGIVMTALMGIVDLKLFTRLFKTCRNEWIIFMLSFLGVLVLGTVNGVIVGCLLSFGEVAMRAVNPPVEWIGRIPGHGNYHSLHRNSHARPIQNTVIYRFNGNLFFANIDRFEQDILNALKEDTHQVVVDARGIGSIDITAVDRLLILYENLKKRGIRFYITEHASSLNDQLRERGGESLLEHGVVRRTISLALRDAGLEKPYHLEGIDDTVSEDYLVTDERLAEFEWAFGDQAEQKMELLADNLAVDLLSSAQNHEEEIAVLTDHGATTKWGMLGLFDEQELWDHMEERLEFLVRTGKLLQKDAEWLETRIEERREIGMKRLKKLNPKALEILHKHREEVLMHFKEKDPKGYEHILKLQEKLHKD